MLKQCNKDLYKYEDWDGEKNFFGAQARKYSGNYKKFPESIQKIVNELYSLKFKSPLLGAFLFRGCERGKAFYEIKSARAELSAAIVFIVCERGLGEKLTE